MELDKECLDYLYCLDRYSCINKYIDSVIEKANLIKIYNKDLKVYMVQDKETGKRRPIWVIEKELDNMQNIGFLPDTTLTRQLIEIYNEFDKLLTHEYWYKHISNWNSYVEDIRRKNIRKQINKILELKDLPQDIIGNILKLKDSTENIKCLEERFYEIVKNICSLTHYIVII